ncbi:MAG: hypothetical protein WCJ57_02450 [Candidatus Falkowbacteria bacterium]
MTETPLNLLPRHINDGQCFFGSKISNNESEKVIRNIVTLQKNFNLHAWTPFSAEDYKSHFKHEVTSEECSILDIFVVGGQPDKNSTKTISSGYLIKDDNGKYQVTEKFLEVVSDFIV